MTAVGLQVSCFIGIRHSKSRKMILSKDKFDAVRRNPYSIIFKIFEKTAA